MSTEISTIAFLSTGNIPFITSQANSPSDFPQADPCTSAMAGEHARIRPMSRKVSDLMIVPPVINDPSSGIGNALPASLAATFPKQFTSMRSDL
jgi:hypothetical protein